MDLLKTQLEYARKAYESAEEAQRACYEILKVNPHNAENPVPTQSQFDTANQGVLAFIRTMAELRHTLERRIAERTARWESVSVLEAVIRCGSKERKIVLAKPNDRIDEPFITESFYTAIRNKWAEECAHSDITTDEPFDILVVNRRGKTIAKIERNWRR